jgi:hypothetical protein
LVAYLLILSVLVGVLGIILESESRIFVVVVESSYPETLVKEFRLRIWSERVVCLALSI